MAEYGIKVVDTSYSINSSLETKKLCCYGCSFTYLTVAQKLNLPIYAAIAPGHIFVIWDDGENEIWWETTGNFLSDKKYYIDYFKLSKDDIGTLNLRKLTSRELEGVIYSQAAVKAEEHIKIEYLTKSLELCPNYESAYKNRGNAKYKIKDFKGAKEDWEKVLEINSTYNDFKFFVDLGCVKNELEDYKGSVEAFNRAIKINSKEDGAFLGRGTAKQLLADTIGAIADYGKAIEINPKGYDAYHNRGIAYYLTGKYKQAISDFDFAVKNGSNDATTFYYRGVANSQLRKFQDAILDFDHTLLVEPNFAKAYFNRGVAKLLLKDFSGGCSDLSKADQMGDVEAKPIMLQYCK